MKLFISACRSNLNTLANHNRSMALAKHFVDNGLRFNVVLGVYPEEQSNGTVSAEVTFMVTIPDDGLSPRQIDAAAQEWAEYASREFQQDCIGLLHDGEFYLAFSTHVEHVGTWKRVEMRPHDKAATQINGQWFIAEKAE